MWKINSDRIPSTNNNNQREKIVNERSDIPGLKKVKGDYGQLASLGQILKDIEFPANKNQIVEFVKSHNSDQNVLQQLQNMEDKENQILQKLLLQLG